MTSYGELSDKELLELMGRDNKLAFNALYNRYWKRVLTLAASKMNDLMEAENIVQDVFCSLWLRRNTLQVSGEFQNYLFVSVKYRVLKVLGKQRAQYLHSLDADMAIDVLDDSTQQYLEFDELRQRLEMAVNALPEKSRLIYRMNKEEGMSYKQIAENLNISEKAVDSQLVRIKRSLRISLRSFVTSVLI